MIKKNLKIKMNEEKLNFPDDVTIPLYVDIGPIIVKIPERRANNIRALDAIRSHIGFIMSQLTADVYLDRSNIDEAITALEKIELN